MEGIGNEETFAPVALRGVRPHAVSFVGNCSI